MQNYDIQTFIGGLNGSQQKTSYTPLLSPVAATPIVTPAQNVDNSVPKDEFIKKGKQGFIEKFYNFLKNKTKIGFGSDKVNKLAQQGASQEELDKAVARYKISQENASQIVGDVASSAVGLGAFFGIKKTAKYLDAGIKISDLVQFFESEFGDSAKFKEITQKIKGGLGSKTKVALVGAAVAAITAGVVKNTVLKLNRIGSGKYKLSKAEKASMNKKEIKKATKKLKRARGKENTRNFLTGAFNGLLAPITTLGGAIAGTAIYTSAVTGMRYASSKEDKNKSAKGFLVSLKNNAVVNLLGTAAIAFNTFKKAKFDVVLTKNIDSVVAKLKDAQLKKPDLDSSGTTYSELEEMLLSSPKIKSILESGKSIDDQIIALTEENIFAVKFKQIQGNSDPISRALREDCPASRTIEAAQEQINRLMGSDKYKVSKCLGVGTVAESYLAKDTSGKEVCIKILKDGISAEKIAADKEKFAALIKNGVADANLSDNQRYLLRNLDNLAEGIGKETNFQNEMEAAKKLSLHTRIANVVKPIEAKEGIYIMEKAPGISLETLDKYHKLENELKLARKNPELQEYFGTPAEIEQRIAALKAKSPDFQDFDMTNEELKKVLYGYIDVMNEQFVSIDKSGKTLHADIHPGNIFINLEALKGGAKPGDKLFTLIDTGNTVDLCKEQSLRALKLASFIRNGNTKDITDFVLDGAILPPGMTKEKATASVQGELRKILFDTETYSGMMDNDNILTLSNQIMRKYNIIPNDGQLNLNKAKKSAENSFQQLLGSFFQKKHGDAFENVETPAEIAAQIASAAKSVAEVTTRKKLSAKLSSMKNIFKMSPKELIRQKFNPDMNKKNSIDYVTYKLKQWRGEKTEDMFERLAEERFGNM